MTKKITYKAFNSDWTCKGFQYEVGKTYKHDGKVKICESGFHSCENPLDCWSYYDITDVVYAEVEVSGETDCHNDDTKIASAEITIKTELKLTDFIKSAINWISEQYKEDSGNGSQHASSGNGSKHVSSGNGSKHASSGNGSQHVSSGGWSKHASSGGWSKHASSGNGSQHVSSGDLSKHASSGYGSQHASSGDWSKHASSGNGSQHASSGNWSQHEAKGKHTVISCAGRESIAKGVNGTWISLAEYDGQKCIGFAIGCIGEDGLKEDTWYKAKSGKLIEAE